MSREFYIVEGGLTIASDTTPGKTAVKLAVESTNATFTMQTDAAGIRVIEYSAVQELESKLAEKDAVISHLKYQRDNYANKAGLLTDENSRMDDAELAELEKGDKV